MLEPKQQRTLEGAMYWVGARLAKEQRASDEWSMSLLLEIHRDLFGGLFPEHAARLRQVEVAFNGRAVPVPAQIQYRLIDVVGDARSIVEESRSIGEVEERIQIVIPRAAALHANCVVLQPFIDGNKRWARQVLSGLLVDCGFWPGARIGVDERKRYMDGIDKSIAGDHDQLAELILESWLRLERDFSSGAY